MAHALYEDRDLNCVKDLFGALANIKTDPEMVQLATQLVERHVDKYDSADLEDRYETRLRAMLDAKLKGEGLDLEAEAVAAPASNVVDLMAALNQAEPRSGSCGEADPAEAQEGRRGYPPDRPQVADQGRQGGR